ncbi:MAG: DUF1670 domain-containing protein [Candidatus Thermoplasmatota archaeon]|nr:DUF1670 domain-containing protein [Candidatus Thermoplasmatota archaeon]
MVEFDKLGRLLQKNVEGQFLWELEHGFELSPRASIGILDTVKLYFGQSNSYNFGQVKLYVVSQNEPAGKPVSELQKVAIWVTLDAGAEDLEIYKNYNLTHLRRIRLLRVVDEVLDGGGVATQEDLARLFQVGIRTIRRDIAYLHNQGYSVVTRGEFCDIGSGVSHRVRIVELYLEGLTYTDICRKMRHSAKAIKRYINTFIRVASLITYGIYSEKDISFYVGISERLSKDYIDLYNRYNTNEKYRIRIKEMTDQIASRPNFDDEKKEEVL